MFCVHCYGVGIGVVLTLLLQASPNVYFSVLHV